MPHGKVGPVHDGMVVKRMKREIIPRAPQVSVVTQTIYASSTSTPSAIPTTDVGIPLGPIIGGMAGGMAIVLLIVGGWFWWGARIRASRAKGAKARRAQHLAIVRTHGKSESTESLSTGTRSAPSLPSEKPATGPASQPVKKPSTILSEKSKSSTHSRSPLNVRAPFTTTPSSKYAPTRPSPLALAVVTRPASAMSEAPPVPTAKAGPLLNVVPPSPLSARVLLASGQRDRRESAQSAGSVYTVASEYSTDSAIGVAYGGNESEQEVYERPGSGWKDWKKGA